MTDARTFLSHGVRVGLRSNDVALLERARDVLPPGWEETSAPTAELWYSIMRSTTGDARVAYQLFQDDHRLETSFRLSWVLDRMDSALRIEVGRRAPDRLFVHAGVVTWKGRAIVIPGRSGAGKSTLVAALVAAGADYASDEYAVLDARGMVHPYPRPISLRQGGNRRVRRCAVADLGGRRADGAAPVGLVVVSRFERGARWSPQGMSAGAAALAMFDNTLAARDKPAFAFSVLSMAVAGATAVTSARGEAEATAAAILAFADTHSPLTPGRS